MHQSDVDDEIVSLSSTVTHCPNCVKAFKVADLKGLHTPLILYCGHSCCENCVREALCKGSFVLCGNCGKKSTPKQPVDRLFGNIRDNFPIAASTVKRLREGGKQKLNDESQIGFTSNSISLSAPSKCQECDKVYADYFCDKCETLLCQLCFSKLHTGKSMMKHRRIPLSDANDSLPFRLDDRSEDYVMDPEEIIEMRDLYEKCQKKIQTVNQSLKLLHFEKFCPNPSMDFQKIREDLEEYFNIAENKLSLKRQEALRQCRLAENSLVSSRKECEKKFQKLCSNLKEISSQMRLLLKEQPIDFDISELREKALNFINNPDKCYLQHAVLPEMEFKLSEDWIEAMEKECTFDFGTGAKLILGNDSFRLVSSPVDDAMTMKMMSEKKKKAVPLEGMRKPLPAEQHLTSDIEILSVHSCSVPSVTSEDYPFTRPNKRSSQLSQVPRSRGPSSVISADFKQNDYSAQNRLEKIHPKPPSSICSSQISTTTSYRSDQSSGFVTERSSTRKLKKTSQRAQREKSENLHSGGLWKNVKVTYIVNPSQFYVRLPCFEYDFKMFNKILCNVGHKAPPEIDHLRESKEQLFLALYKDNIWYRVRVQKINVNSYDIGLSLITVFFVDTGQTENIPLKNIREMDDFHCALGRLPYLAQECCLFDCYPPNGITWSDKDIESFTSRITTSKVTMKIVKVHSSKMDVDLLLYNEGSQYNGSSVREFLINSDHAKLCSIKQHVIPLNIANRDLKYYYDNDFPYGDWIDVTISHVLNPCKLFVTRKLDKESEARYTELRKNMNNFYKNVQNYHHAAIRDFYVEQPVAAKFSGDGMWYRAKIIEISPTKGDGLKKVQVHYVDFGNREWLTAGKVRLLNEDYVKLVVQAILCLLKDIKRIPAVSPVDARKLIMKYFENKTLKLVVREQIDDVLSVDLFENANENPKQIQQWLIGQGLVRGIGSLAKVQTKKKKEHSNEEKSVKSESISKEEKHAAYLVDAATDGNSSEVLDEEHMTVDSSEDNMGGKHTPPKRKFEVKVVSFVKPNSFYVSFANRQSAILNLNSELMNFYREGPNNEATKIEEIKIGMKCAVFCVDDQKWCRGKVTKVDKNKVEVFLSDFGKDVIVNATELRSLPDKFNTEADGATHCALHGFEDNDDWPSDLCESMKEELAKFQEFYLVNKERRDNNFIIIQLWGRNIICRGALDPMKEKWTNINLKFLHPDSDDASTMSDDFQPDEVNVGQLDEEVGIENTNDQVVKWLQSSISQAAVNGIKYVNLIKNDPLQCTQDHDDVISDNSVDDNADDVDESMVILEEADGNVVDWKEPEELLEERFVGRVTHIDPNGILYVQVSADDILKRMQDGLNSRFKDEPFVPTDLHWRVGEICVALYEEDLSWNRARIVQINPTAKMSLQVEYVDYGNLGWCEPKMLRKKIAFVDICIQCHKIPFRSDLKPIYPDGKWSGRSLSVFKEVIEQQCQISLWKENGENFYRVEKLKLLSDPEKNVFNKLLSLNEATLSTPKRKIHTVKEETEEFDSSSSSLFSISAVECVSNPDEVLEEMNKMDTKLSSQVNPWLISQNPSDISLVIPSFNVPVTDDKFRIKVTDIHSVNEIVVNILSCESYPAIENDREKYNNMTNEMQNEAENLPAIDAPYEGRVCCALFEDDVWYRALITDAVPHDSKYARIFYFDYGNTTNCRVSELHEMKPEWYQIPMQSIKCLIEDLEVPVTESERRKLSEQLANILLNGEFTALLSASKVVDKLYSIKFFNEDGSSPYQLMAAQKS